MKKEKKKDHKKEDHVKKFKKEQEPSLPAEEMKIPEISGWMFLVLSVASVVAIWFFPGRSINFLIWLVTLPITAVWFRKKYGSSDGAVARVLLGLLFIFSGFVKGVDPVGTQYRIEDYFTAFGTDWAKPFALVLSVVMNTVEFAFGVLLLINFHIRILRWFVAAMMLFFTVVTLNDALNNPVPDCGCFGEVLKMSNWQTLYKNIVLDGLVIMVFYAAGKLKFALPWRWNWGLALGIPVLFVLIQVYSIRHLPLIDAAGWARGRVIEVSEPLPPQLAFVYKNKSTGETKEYMDKELPWQDPEWVSQWEFVDRKEVIVHPEQDELVMFDEKGTDMTPKLLGDGRIQMLLVSWDILGMEPRHHMEIKEMSLKLRSAGVRMFGLTGSLPETLNREIQELSLGFEFYYCDDTVLKALIRSNPGLVLVVDGTIVEKWHHNDVPSFEDIKAKYALFF